MLCISCCVELDGLVVCAMIVIHVCVAIVGRDHANAKRLVKDIVLFESQFTQS